DGRADRVRPRRGAAGPDAGQLRPPRGVVGRGDPGAGGADPPAAAGRAGRPRRRADGLRAADDQPPGRGAEDPQAADDNYYEPYTSTDQAAVRRGRVRPRTPGVCPRGADGGEPASVVP